MNLPSLLFDYYNQAQYIFLIMISKNQFESSQIEKDYNSLLDPANELQKLTKKKAFSRKPAASQFSNLSEKKQRLNNQRKISIAPFLTSCHEQPSKQESPLKINFVKRKERQSEFFTKQKDESFEGSFKRSKERVSNPFLSRDNIHQSSCLLSEKDHSQNSYSSKNTERNQEIACNSLTSNILSNKLYKRQQINEDQRENNQNILKFRAQSTLALQKYLPKTQMKFYRSSNNSRNSSATKNDITLAFQCSYCKNSKQMITLMNEKYAKIKEQIDLKDSKIEQINTKFEILKQQYIKLNEKYEKKLQSIQLKEIYLFRQKQEFMNRTESLKNDLAKAYERIKYYQIQNCMLLRYKDQYQLITRQYDLICCENQKLQNLLTLSRRGEREDDFKKGRNPICFGSPSHHNYNKNTNQQESTQEDDLVSLTFSQKSLETY